MKSKFDELNSVVDEVEVKYADLESENTDLKSKLAELESKLANVESENEATFNQALEAMATDFKLRQEALLATSVTFEEWQRRATDRLFERLKAGGSRLVTTELLVHSMRFCASSLGVSFKKMPALYNHMWALLMGTEPTKNSPCERTCKQGADGGHHSVREGAIGSIVDTWHPSQHPF